VPYFTEPRNIELSTLEYLNTQIDASWSGVTVVKTFTQAYSKNINLPIVCVRLLDQSSSRLEIGSNTLDNRYGIAIDIFARSDGQRIDLANFILDKLKDGWVYYVFSHKSGDKSQLEKIADGRIQVTDFMENYRIDFGELEVDEKDRFRHFISVRVRKS